MNVKNNKGFAGIDISISLIILLIFIPTAFGIVYNIQKTNKDIERKSKAIEIAVEVLETEKASGFEGAKASEPYSVTKGDAHYKVTTTLKSSNETQKVINVKVEYPIGKDTKSIDISTAIKKVENISRKELLK